MKIKEITSQHRRDFTATYICEHCGHEHVGSGYDDNHFHTVVIPSMVCKQCGEVSVNYRPLQPKYNESRVI